VAVFVDQAAEDVDALDSFWGGNGVTAAAAAGTGTSRSIPRCGRAVL
jgi:hypothetical protein